MTNANDVRRAHKIIEDIIEGYEPTLNDMETLRSFLPELPKQKTLEEIYKYVDDAWLEADDPESKEWLHELHAQLQGLKDAPVAVPALPAGMRLADHAELGRVVVSPTTDEYEDHRIFYLNPCDETGAKSRWASVNSLTFIDTAPAKPAYPEFLETEADYSSAPNGTIVARNDNPPWYKFGFEWSSAMSHDRQSAKGMASGRRYILRWGWGK